METLTDLERLLSNFAFHIRDLATMKPGKFCMGLDYNGKQILFQGEIKPADGTDGGNTTPVWDQVYIDGKCIGNRAAGSNEYAKQLATLLSKEV